MSLPPNSQKKNLNTGNNKKIGKTESTDRCILSVALNTPLRHSFDYFPPLEHSETHLLQPGVRIRVPLGKSERIGIIDAVKTNSDYDHQKIKSAFEVLDETPLFSELDLKLLRWTAQYYQVALGEVFDVALPSWLKKGKLLFTPPPPLPPAEKTFEAPLLLNSEQQQAVHAILADLKKFQVFLLEGITGSGKTEVYLEVIEACLKQQIQALILVPEIGLTPQMLSRLEARFSVPIAVLHSSLSEKKRFIAWQMARTGVAPIVIGTRSAAFTPLKTPGVFIIDEEHDASFKQQENLRYSARDLLIMRAHLEGCPIVLGTATPSLETLHNVQTGRYQRLRLPTRAGKAKPPKIHILDIRHRKLDEGLSSHLIQSMRDHLAHQGQVLLFLNRRGYAPVLMCFDCGWVAECKQCSARLTVHYQTRKLRCHHCEFSMPLLANCPSCQTKNLNSLGIGTERVEAALKAHFPDREIIRIDRDTTRKKQSLETAINRIHNEEAHILLGTQMIAKGHHFPNITLVGIIDVDSALFSTDFRSTERLGQLITQVAGRAGRAERLGEVILQSCHPEHPLIKLLIEKGYPTFAEKILIERESANLPPFSYQALLRADAKVLESTLHFLTKVKEAVQCDPLAEKVQILGPIVCPMERKGGKHRAQLLLQSANRTLLQKVLRELLLKIEKLSYKKSLRWFLDIDPTDLL